MQPLSMTSPRYLLYVYHVYMSNMRCERVANSQNGTVKRGLYCKKCTLKRNKNATLFLGKIHVVLFKVLNRENELRFFKKCFGVKQNIV